MILEVVQLIKRERSAMFIIGTRQLWETEKTDIFFYKK